MAKKDDGCAYGQVNRQMVIDIKQEIADMRKENKDGFDDLKGQMRELFNHQSGRLPAWVTLVLTILSGIAVWAVTHK